MASADRDQSFSQFKSPNPELSRLCLALAMVQATLLLLAYHRSSDNSVHVDTWALIKVFGLTGSTVLAAAHYSLRYNDYGQLSRDTLPRATRSASPLLAGLASVCGLAVFSASFDANHFFEYQAEMCFWAGYWAEWWTGHLGAKLEEYGC